MRNAPPPTRNVADGSKRNGLPKTRYFFDEHRESESKAWVGVLVCIGAILLLIGICAAVKASRNNDNYVQADESGAKEYDVTYTESQKYEPKRYNELNGMTIDEWMRKNNTNNAMLKARLEGVKKARSVKTNWPTTATE